jgi:adenine-specific DNA-methyltransferase
MSTNISKKKRDDLLDKIKQIRAFIAAAPQDENTGNLLSYLSELEKDVNGKKYGLVFEEHREEIDEVLDTHTPVLTEDADLFIDHGGQMNFLLEGDNLAALKLLEKTHRGKIDLIYIDPPYNTGNKDFIYDDAFVDKTDGFIHSKWISFMNERLKMARHLLSFSLPRGLWLSVLATKKFTILTCSAKTYSSIGKLLRLQFKHLAESQMVDSITHKNIFCSLYQ